MGMEWERKEKNLRRERKFFLSLVWNGMTVDWMDDEVNDHDSDTMIPWQWRWPFCSSTALALECSEPHLPSFNFNLSDYTQRRGDKREESRK